ncbi:MAG: response regulator transcription factor [Opitutaceae bacterium]|nr:response regulator transcription factor [Cytophagales bacterium]
MNKIKLFLVDDHEIFRNGVKQLINSETDMTVIGEAASGEEAIQLLNTIEPDVIIMDIRMPGISGLDATKSILKPNSKSKLIFFSLYDREDYVSSALDMGAQGYILKDTSNKIFLSAIRAVNNGQYYFIGEVTDILVKKYQELKKNTSSDDISNSTNVKLSKREEDILRLIGLGISNKDIADNYGISIRTIETHRLNIMRKFKKNSIEEIIETTRKSGSINFDL